MLEDDSLEDGLQALEGVHGTADNYGTRKHEPVKKWLNLVERFFRNITTKTMRRGAFRSVDALVLAIENYIAQHSLDPKPLIWTAKAGDVLAKQGHARSRRTRESCRSA